MTSRGSLLLTVAVVLGITIAVVAYDLSSHRASWAESTRRPPVPLAIASPNTKTREPDFAEEGFAQFALLTETAGAGTAVVVATHDIARAEAAGLEIVPCVPDAGGASSSLARAG